MTDCPDDKSDLLKIDALIKAGELLAAYDKARMFLKSRPHSLPMCHRAVLCLARAGALEQAQKEYNRLGLDAVTDDEDILALGGRVLKAIALEETGQQRHRLALASADKYAQAYRKTGGYFSGINTATMSLIAGNKDRAMSMARQVLGSLSGISDARSRPTYYQEATRAEAFLLLGRRDESKDHLARAVACDMQNYSARAGTLAQLETIENALGHDPQWLDAFCPPNTMHFTGHMFDTRQDKETHNENAIIERVTRFIYEEDIGFGFGALAAGADIIIAETLLALGKELHLVQPAPDEAFIKASLIPFGPNWHDRFRFCKARASTISYINDGRLIPDGLDMAFSSRVAMGHAVMRARAIGSKPIQFAVWDGQPVNFPAGTAHDVTYWRQTGRRQVIHPFKRIRNTAQHSGSHSNRPQHTAIKRDLMAMLFLDTHGFGQLDDEGASLFIENVLRPMAACCAQLKGRPSLTNTWGDGLFLAFDDIVDAAEAALILQREFRKIDLVKAGLPNPLSIRIGCHFGPVQQYIDPFLNRPNIFGKQVTIAARIEQVTLPGSIYVSEPFASILTTSSDHNCKCEYIGRIRTRTKAGAMPLFSLRHTAPQSRYQNNFPISAEGLSEDAPAFSRQDPAVPNH